MEIKIYRASDAMRLAAGIGNITSELRSQGIWESSLIVMFADNGGDCNTPAKGPSNNYPMCALSIAFPACCS